jgi:hypothetical protein
VGFWARQTRGGGVEFLDKPYSGRPLMSNFNMVKAIIDEKFKKIVALLKRDYYELGEVLCKQRLKTRLRCVRPSRF